MLSGFQRASLGLLLLAVLINPLTGVERAWAQNACAGIFVPPPYVRPPKIYPENLTSLYQREMAKLSIADVRAANESLLKQLNSDVPALKGGRAQYATYEDIARLLEVTKENPVVGRVGQKAFEREDARIGFCFGRATYLHLMLLKMGLQENSIRKIWALGPMKSYLQETVWQMHVATMVFTRDRGWMTIDTNTSKPEIVRHWIETYRDRSLDERIRFYVTEPERFTPDIPVYDRLQLGMNLDPAQDWYRGYFPAAIKSVRETPLESLGLRKLPPTPEAEVVKVNPQADSGKSSGWKLFPW